VPKHRSLTVAYDQQSVAGAADLRHARMAGGPRVLPKLAVGVRRATVAAQPADIGWSGAEVVAARLLPLGASEPPTRATGERLPCSWLTRPPVRSGSRSAFPLQSESRCSPGVSCRRARSHAGSGPSTASPTGLWTALGTTRATLLTAGRSSVDNRVSSWGRPRERESPFVAATCSEPGPAPVDSKILHRERGVAAACDTRQHR